MCIRDRYYLSNKPGRAAWLRPQFSSFPFFYCGTPSPAFSFHLILFIDTSISSHYYAQSSEEVDHNSIIPMCEETSQYVKAVIFRKNSPIFQVFSPGNSFAMSQLGRLATFISATSPRLTFFPGDYSVRTCELDTRCVSSELCICSVIISSHIIFSFAE